MIAYMLSVVMDPLIMLGKGSEKCLLTYGAKAFEIIIKETVDSFLDYAGISVMFLKTISKRRMHSLPTFCKIVVICILKSFSLLH